MGIIAWIIIGLIVGWLAGLLIRGGGYGFVGNIIVGIVGALLGGWIASALFGVDAFGVFDLGSFFWALVGSVILVFLLQLFTRRPVYG